MADAGPVGVFGGTFDPVHIGHITLAQQIKQSLGMDRLFLQPAHIPPHKSLSGANSQQRAAMVNLAAENTGLDVDLRELDRDGPSYTVDTLLSWRQQLGPDRPLCFCLGMDSLLRLNTWARWQELFDLAHLVVVARPNWDMQYHLQNDQIDVELRDVLQQRKQDSVSSLQQLAAGFWHLCELPQLDVSSTDIRHKLSTGVAANTITTLPKAVAHYIKSQNLYCD